MCQDAFEVLRREVETRACQKLGVTTKTGRNLVGLLCTAKLIEIAEGKEGLRRAVGQHV